jgi:hypothetical protein
MTTTTRPTYALQNGDIVNAHGCRFRLSDKRAVSTSYREPLDLSGCAFTTTYVGPVTPNRDPIAEHGPYGRDMVAGKWVIQGNAYATWSVEA